MALVERERSGQGQFIDMTLYDAGIALMHPHIAELHAEGQGAGADRQRPPEHRPYDKFPTRTVDVFLAIGNDRAFGRLCAELGAPELAATRAFAPTAIGSPTAPADRALRRCSPSRTARRSARGCSRPACRPGRYATSRRSGRTPTPITAPWRPSAGRTRAGACRSSSRARPARSPARRRASARTAARSWPSSASRPRSTGWPRRRAGRAAPAPVVRYHED